MMNLFDSGIDCMRYLAENDSAGDGIDEDWEVVLSETDDIIAIEIFLALHRKLINDSMNCWAAEVALTHPPRDICDIDDAKLYLHCLVRWIWLGIADNLEFQAYVDANVSRVIHTGQGAILNPQRMGWAKSSLLWLPISEENFVQIAGALVERFKNYLFAEHCWHELTQRHVGNQVNKDMFALLIDSDIVTQKYQDEAYQRLTNLSAKVSKGLPGIEALDLIHDWLTKLLALPRHTQLKKIRATRKAIHDRVKDIQRKGGKYEHVSFEGDGEYADKIPDDSLRALDNGIMGDEFLQLISANRQKIEGILHQNVKIAARRFQVLEKLAHTPALTCVEIAGQLDASEQTIGRDKHAIMQNWPAIRDVIYSQ